MKKILLVIIALILLSLPLVTLTAHAADEDSEPVTCQDGQGSYFDRITMDLGNSDGTYIATELHEPISSLEDKIQSGGITVSQIYMKYQCKTLAEQKWVEAEDGTGYELKWIAHINEVTSWIYIPYESSGGACPDGANCTYVQVIVAKSGTAILKTYISILYRWAASIVGIIAVLVMVVSGIQISVDQGSGEQVSSAKTRIMQSLAALAILFLSALILYTINPTFFTI